MGPSTLAATNSNYSCLWSQEEVLLQSGQLQTVLGCLTLALRSLGDRHPWQKQSSASSVWGRVGWGGAEFPPVRAVHHKRLVIDRKVAVFVRDLRLVDRKLCCDW